MLPTGTKSLRIDIASVISACPPPVTVCPHTAAMLHSHHFTPLRVLTFDEVGNACSILQPPHCAVCRDPESGLPVLLMEHMDSSLT